MKHKRIYIGVGIILVIFIAVWIGKKELFNNFFSPVKLQYISNYLSNNYLYEFDEEKGLEAVYSGYLSGTQNSVTYYLNEDDYNQAIIEEAGNYYGNGISMTWSIDGQSFIITDVVTGSPADEAGIIKGDKVTQINDIPVLMANSQELVQAAFSTKPEVTHYYIEHDGKQEDIALKPKETEVVDLSDQMIDGVLYIKVNEIKEGTSQKIESLLATKESSQCKGIILDIRDLYTNNIEDIGDICDLFLDEGVAFKVKTKKENMTAYTMTEGADERKLCVIVNTNTRSGGEALALGLKDRATIIGSGTAGLSYLRTLVSLEDGSGMSVASGIICDQYGTPLLETGIEPNERVFISENEKIEILQTGEIKQENDSFINAALKQF